MALRRRWGGWWPLATRSEIKTCISIRKCIYETVLKKGFKSASRRLGSLKRFESFDFNATNLGSVKPVSVLIVCANNENGFTKRRKIKKTFTMFYNIINCNICMKLNHIRYLISDMIIIIFS